VKEFEGTEGPWWLEDEDFSTDGEDAVITCEARYGMVEIARIGQGGTQRDIEEDFANEQRANALLMVTAPELLEALLRIRAQFDQAGISPVEGSLNPVEDNYAFINAVIAKALGE